jgi:hypothetical protein
MALFPFILIKRRQDFFNDQLVRHEQIHIRQQLELLILPFYLLYLIHYLVNFCIYFNHDKAYRNIVFEKEAYQNDQNVMYLSNRRAWSFLKYF